MKKRRFAGICMAVLLAGMTGCANEVPAAQTETELSTQAESRTAAKETENVSVTAADDSSDSVEDVAGQGFVPPKGSRVDSNGNIATPSGETFSKDGGWAVPEGGHVDSQGRIIDKNGNVMGGGAPVGSKG